MEQCGYNINDINDIIDKGFFGFEQTDMAKYAHILASKKFIYIKDNGIYKLYCYNGKVWENDSVLMKHFLSNELYNFLKMILVELYFEHNSFNKMKMQIKKLKTMSYENDVIEAYKAVGVNMEIKFRNLLRKS